MTLFRFRVLAVLMLVFAALPVLAQEEAVAGGLPPTASIGCLLVGGLALIAVGALASAREARGDADPTLQPKPNEEGPLPPDSTFAAPSA